MADSDTDGRQNYRDVYEDLQQKWKPVWKADGLYRTTEDPAKPKFYCLEFFPYPSGSGLSVGHLRNYVPCDVISRYRRMKGYNVLHPMGWDAFGFPAENYAIKMGVHPRETTATNVANYKRQFDLVETCHDWDKEINSTDPAYYRWTQWFFKLLFERGLAYQAEGMQWWCPECKSVLANEQVENGCCWRHGDVQVTKKALKQWFFKITDYAEPLLRDLDTVDWPEHIKKMQVNWIGRSEGCQVTFTARNPESGATFDFPIFTTRVDTIFGVTYMVMAPEHPLVEKLTTSANRAAVAAYLDETAKKSEIDRTSTEKAKTGVPTGAVAVNPANGEEVPIWVGDYVLAGYGTGTVMAVPAHDTRDFAFATTYGLPIRQVISPTGAEQDLADAFTTDGTMLNSGRFDGQPSEKAIDAIADWFVERGVGAKTVNYRFRDWLISRQRYWGAPIPVIHCPDCGPVAVPDDQLPVTLPEMDVEHLQPKGTGESPLARCEEFVNAPCPTCGKPGRRETDTMDGFACSSWYFLRYPNPRNEDAPFDPEKCRYWLPVDLYVGGAEHAVMHLLYARFWTKVMNDAGLVDFREPFTQLRNQGMMVGADGRKMSKSLGNVVTPDSVVATHGADCLRAYILFLGTFDQEVAWSDTAISGIFRFLERVWEMGRETPGVADGPAATGKPAKELRRALHATVKRVTECVESFSFNTAVASMMELRNTMAELARTEPSLTGTRDWYDTVSTMLVTMAPFTPFITEELWEQTGRRAALGLVHRQPWPTWDEAALTLDEQTYPVQINGKIRDEITVPVDMDDEGIRAIVMERPQVKKYLEGVELKKFIVVRGRLVSLAVK